MKLHIEHLTRYRYDQPVSHTIQHLRLTPQSGLGQTVHRWNLKTRGRISAQRDSYGNLTHTLVLPEKHNEIEIFASGEVETNCNPLPAQETLPVAIFLRTTTLTAISPELIEFCGTYRGQAAQQMDGLVTDILARVSYVRGITDVQTTAANAFSKGAGVCQDHAHIFIACCRSLGIPARYVSGYLFTTDGSLCESHAWADAWDGDRWVSYDVSNGQRAHGIHVRVAHGLDYRDACPVAGVRRGGGNEQMLASVQISQVQQ
ncbi:MAG: transglutaminase family protein [Gallionella sp.]|nr:transglutaminase family protein [Gallionella sp.]